MKPTIMLTKLRVLALLAATISATPIGLGAGPVNHTLDARDNPVSCGWNNMYPCAAGQICYTSNNLPLCANAAQQTAPAANNGGTYQMFTTTYTINGPIPVTSTYSALVGGPTGGTCDTSKGQHECNPYLCCAADQWCDNSVGSGQCRAFAAAGSPGLSPGLPPVTVTVTTMNGVPTTMTMSISNYVAPTSISTVTLTSSGTYTTTQALETPVGSSGNSIGGVTAQPQTSSGLSGGAIAGIVIGVLIGLFILFVVLTCLCCKGIFDLIFGKKKEKKTETYIHTHHSTHGSHHSGRPPPRRWFGILPGKNDRPDRPEKKDSGLGGLLAIGGALAALAVFLGLKRKDDRRREEEKSEYTNSVDYYSDYYTETSASSASSDRRTRNTHRSDGRSRR